MKMAFFFVCLYKLFGFEKMPRQDMIFDGLRERWMG